MSDIEFINKRLDALVNDFLYVLQKYLSKLEDDDGFHTNKEWQQAMDINQKWFNNGWKSSL